ncbi:gamma-butyrobetaine dioxygenase-like [Homarus americanus]|uniref:gamma-butyrobetaine dioxygenase-like n=1 Tax=Homarus americanus TaxID=6706 RepID=UPI001C4713D4|nr:gamma-butyrobetaine dioxygenase-like [Homarus americanus]XP_042205657.1 gamma-butyrobetaine dioxygenase-like [Homarus americanus]XP_042205658.1 gamma-butyrobetaine dioxygenase-like [Homarus americanus]XP_042205659.1 gamma-butyrobetaine dioxygenase-like [Homarus americanus]
MSRLGWQRVVGVARLYNEVRPRTCAVQRHFTRAALLATLTHPQAAHATSTPTRSFHTTSTFLLNTSEGVVRKVEKGDTSLLVEFSDGTREEFPYCWLRDNCQCPRCYDETSFTRRLTLDDWDHTDHPIQAQVSEGGMILQWSSGHHSHYKAQWLQKRAFNLTPRAVKRAKLALKKDLWGPDFKLTTFDYEELVGDEKVLLQWLVTMEKVGVTIITNTPREPRACFNIINKVGFVKPTHYGVHYPIRNKLGANSLAYTDSKLGMHNDLPYYEYVPGIIFLHCITQFTGEGGENDLTDGFHVAEYMRRHHPQEYELLTDTPVYFWNKGSALVEQETTEFYKLLNIPMIVVNRKGEVMRVNNSQLRDSYLDLPPHQVAPWYSALRLYNRVIEEQAIRNKLNDGETMVMDNTRLLHGRTAYNGAVGERYMDQVYLDWDEAVSTRRVLQEKYDVSLQ